MARVMVVYGLGRVLEVVFQRRRFTDFVFYPKRVHDGGGVPVHDDEGARSCVTKAPELGVP